VKCSNTGAGGHWMAFRKMGRDFPSKIGIKMDVQLGSMGKTFQKKKGFKKQVDGDSMGFNDI
jgi:hypothetical protein